MKKRVLVIEDNEQNRYLVTFLLERDGFEVVHAATGIGGIEKAHEEEFDLILLDIQLPAMDGYAVVKALRTHPPLEQVPVVAVTSYAMAGDREKALEAGCDGYLEKPINPETFVADVRRYLSREDRARAEGGTP